MVIRGLLPMGQIAHAAMRTAAFAGARPRAAPSRVGVSMEAVRHASGWMHPGVVHPPQKNMARKMRGRGRGNGLGKTSGQGQMGQTSRSGPRKPRLGFEGGQTPLTKLFPKKGKRNALAKEFATVTLGRIQTWISRGLIDPRQKITIPVLVQTNCISRAHDGVKLLANKSDNFSTPIDIEVTQASPEAINLVELNDGTITARYHGKVYLRSLLRPFKWLDRGRPLPTPPIPFGKKDLSTSHVAPLPLWL